MIEENDWFAAKMAGDASACSSSIEILQEIGSNKNLWILLSGASLTSKDLVGTELQTNLKKICNGLNFFLPQTPETAKKFQNDTKVDAELSKMIIQMSKFMVEYSHSNFGQGESTVSLNQNLDECQCYELFCDFLLYEYRGTDSALQKIIVDERLMQTLMLQMWEYYRGERLYLLLCIKEILSHYDDLCHPYHDLFNEFVTLVDENNELQSSLFCQWESLLKAAISRSKTPSSFMVDKQTRAWWMFTLREQCELLQIMLIYYDGKSCDAETLSKLLTSFKDHGFGWWQSYNHLLDESSNLVLQSIGSLECLVLLRVLSLNSLETDENHTHFLFLNKQRWQKLDHIVCRFGSQREHGPLMLAWSIIRYHVMGEEDFSVCRSLGNSALHCGAFAFLLAILQSHIFQEGVVASCVRSVIYSLLSSLLTQFDEASLGDTTILYKIAEKLLVDPVLAGKFWSQGLNSGLGTLLTSAMEKFPHSFCPTVDFLAALSEASPSSASDVIALFCKLPHLTLILAPQMRIQELWNEEGHPLQLLENYYPFSTDTICVHAGTVGYPLADLLEEDVIRWHQSVNGWQISLLIINQTLQLTAAMSDFSKDKIQQMNSLTVLIRNLLRNSEVSSSLAHMIDQIFLVVQRFAELQQPPVDVIAASLELAAAVQGEDHMLLMWGRVVRTGILPLRAGGINTFVFNRDVDFNRGAINSIIASCECVTGDYSMTLAFLDLISNYVTVLIDRDDDHFLSCVTFLVREIFPSHSRWWYRRTEQKERIAQRCLSIFHRILRMPFTELASRNGDARSSSLQKVVVQCILQEEAGPALLQMICTGEETICKALEHQISWVSGQGLELLHTVKLALSVLNRLLILWRYGKKEHSPLVATLCSDPLAIRTVANYVYHRFDTRLATLGILLMKRFARELPISLLVCLETDAPAFCKLLLLRLEARAEDIRLKSAILNFLSVCVACQPGTTEAIIGDVRDDNSEKENEVVPPKSRCLKLVVDLLRCHKQQDLGSFEELYSAALFFLKSLWTGRQTLALSDLKACPDLWLILLDPLLHDSGSVPSRVSEFTLTILAQEFLFPKSYCPQPRGQLVNLLSKLTSSSAIVDWTTSLYEKCISHSANVAATVADASLITSFTDASASGSGGLLRAWKDFLVVGAKSGLLEVSPLHKTLIVKNTITTLSGHLTNEGDKNCLIILSEILLHLLHSWNDYELNGNERITHLRYLLDPLLNFGDSIPSKVVANVVASCLLLVPSTSEKSALNLLDDETTSSFMGMVCNITHQSVLVNDKVLVDGAPTKIRLVVLCVNLLQRFSWVCCNPDMWLLHLHRSSVVHSLLNFVLRCLQLHKAVDACHDILRLFCCFSRFVKICESFLSVGVVQVLCLPLAELATNQIENGGGSSQSMGVSCQVKWSDVYHSAINLITLILHSQRHFVVEATLDFASVHLPLFQLVPLHLHKNLSPETLDSALSTLQLVHELSHFQALWQLHAMPLLKELLQMMSGVCYVAVAFLLRPRFILHSIEEGKELATKMMPKMTKDDDQNLLRRMSSTEEIEKFNPKLMAATTKLLRIAYLCISTLNNFSPDVSELLSEQGYDTSQWKQLLEVSFGSPSLDQITPTSFGTIISIATICLRIVTGGDRASSPAQVTPLETSNPNRQLVMCLLEKSLYLILSQASLILSNVHQPQWDQQLFKRELGAELSSFVQSRYLKRGSAASPISSPGQSRSRLPIEKQPFLSLVSALADTMFK